MVTPTAGSVVLVPFPFSDLSQAKLRLAVVLANAGRGDWVLCQITSNPYGDPCLVELTDADFSSGSLRLGSCARPGKLFTANETLMSVQAGKLLDAALRQTIQAVIDLLMTSLPR